MTFRNISSNFFVAALSYNVQFRIVAMHKSRHIAAMRAHVYVLHSEKTAGNGDDEKVCIIL